MHPERLVIRCMAIKDGPLWVGLCVDLDLATQGDSLAEVKDRLDAQIRDYVREAVTVDREHAPRLLRRKAPLRYRLTYRWLQLRERVTHHLNGGAAYERSMPLVPAGA